MSAFKHRLISRCWIIGFAILLASSVFAVEDIITPEAHFGYHPGTDRMMFDYEELVNYLEKLDAASDRLKMIEIGKSPEGHR